MIRLLPVPFYDVRRCEQYFSDMSKKGYHVKGVWLRFVRFAKGKPKSYEYRIRPLMAQRSIWFFRHRFIINRNKYYAKIKDEYKDKKIFEFNLQGYSLLFSYFHIFVFRGEKENIRSTTMKLSDNYITESLMTSTDSFQMASIAFILLLVAIVVMTANAGIVYFIANGSGIEIFFILLAFSLLHIIKVLRYESQFRKKKSCQLKRLCHGKIRRNN